VEWVSAADYMRGVGWEGRGGREIQRKNGRGQRAADV
jgi:hypothetical protein